MNTFRRAWLFARDYCDEFGVAWSLARTRDCERNGGHRWGKPARDSIMGLSRTCSRCGCSETVSQTYGTASTTATSLTYTLYP